MSSCYHCQRHESLDLGGWAGYVRGSIGEESRCKVVDIRHLHYSDAWMMSDDVETALIFGLCSGLFD